jgi:hypothetical protein
MRMIRKQIYIEANQEMRLKRLSRVLGVSEAELIRRGIDRSLTCGAHTTKDLASWEEALSFMQALHARGPVKGRREWTRDEIHER